MDVWREYESKFSRERVDMNDRWNAARDRIRDRQARKLLNSPSYQHVDLDGTTIGLAILNTSEFSTKKIFSMPGEQIPHGSVVTWEGSKWLITERNAHNELCENGKMRRCNYFLKWLNDAGEVVGRWCIVEDGTKYLIGEKNGNMMTVGDSRMAVTLGKDEETNKINRGRRFLIDDLDSTDVLAFEVTKPNKLFNVFDGKGVFRFIVGETERTDYDNVEERIADYYSPEDVQSETSSASSEGSGNRKVWL